MCGFNAKIPIVVAGGCQALNYGFEFGLDRKTSITMFPFSAHVGTRHRIGVDIGDSGRGSPWGALGCVHISTVDGSWVVAVDCGPVFFLDHLLDRISWVGPQHAASACAWSVACGLEAHACLCMCVGGGWGAWGTALCTCRGS